MEVIEIAFEKTSGVTKEIQVLENKRQEMFKALNSCQDPNDYVKGYLESANGMEFQRHAAQLPPHQKILDVGFGHGETSLYLALLGHHVFSVDPSPMFCELLNGFATKFSLPITVYQATAEAIDQIPETNFDVCLFTASLHHCDDPLQALKLCHQKLKTLGNVLLINEPLLKFYRSKKWYQYMLEFHPEKVGHYGGNEHIYYYNEYLFLLKNAGFNQTCDDLHIRLLHPRFVIRDDFSLQFNGVPYSSDLKCCIKFAALLIIKGCLKNRWFGSLFTKIMKQLSLIPVSFQAVKE